MEHLTYECDTLLRFYKNLNIVNTPYFKELLEKRIREIKEDYYIFDEKQYALVGQSTHKVLQLGDEVVVKVKNADLVKKQLDFTFIRSRD